MAGDKTTKYIITGDASDLTKALAKTEKSLKRVEKQAKKTDHAVDESTKPTDKAAAAMAAASTRSEQMGGALEGLKQAATGTGGKVGEMAGRVEAFGRAASELASPIGLGVAAVVALTAAVAGTGAAMVAAVFKADDFAESLEPFQDLEGFEIMTPEALASIEASNAAADSLGIVFKQIATTIAGSVAPSVETFMTGLLAVSLVGVDFFNTFTDGQNILLGFVKFLVDGFTPKLNLMADAFVGITRIWAFAARALGMDGLAGKLDLVNEKYDAMGRSIGGVVVGLLEQAIAAGVSSEAFGDYLKRAEDMIAIMSKIRAEKDKDKDKDTDTEAKKNLEAYQKALETFRDAYQTASDDIRSEDEKIIKAGERRKNKLMDQYVAISKMATLTEEQKVAAFRAAIAAMEEIDENTERARSAAEALATQTKLQNAAAVAHGLINLSNMITDAAVEGADAETEAGRKALATQFAMKKAAGISSVIVSTAVAIASALPLGPIAGPILAAIYAATGAAQIGIIAAEQPNFHQGGIIPGAGDTSITAEGGEGILSRRGVAAVGGPQGVNAINAGGGGSGAVVISQVYKHRVFDVFVRDNLRQRGPLARAIQGDTRIGHSGRSVVADHG